jgi:hypothetical protein
MVHRSLQQTLLLFVGEVEHDAKLTAMHRKQ